MDIAKVYSFSLLYCSPFIILLMGIYVLFFSYLMCVIMNILVSVPGSYVKVFPQSLYLEVELLGCEICKYLTV